jgi:hypothetical protein
MNMGSSQLYWNQTSVFQTDLLTITLYGNYAVIYHNDSMEPAKLPMKKKAAEDLAYLWFMLRAGRETEFKTGEVPSAYYDLVALMTKEHSGGEQWIAADKWTIRIFNGYLSFYLLNPLEIIKLSLSPEEATDYIKIRMTDYEDRLVEEDREKWSKIFPPIMQALVQPQKAVSGLN